MNSRQHTYRELTLQYMEKIAEHDGLLNSVAEINPDALTIATMLDNEKGMSRGALHGVPILLKDNINTHDKMQTTAGSLALNNHYASYDAAIVQNLRNAGAIILGKTNMTEMSNWMASDMPNGYSSRGGQVKNLHNHDPSGSSTGSAVAVAAGFCVAAVGTETCGSIIDPSAAAGIVGIKPSAGFFPTHGIVPISSTLDTPGPMARTVRDAAILLSGMKGQNDAIYMGSVLYTSVWTQTQKDYIAGLDNASIRGLRIGIYNEGKSDPVIKKTIEKLETAGAFIIAEYNGVTPDDPWEYIGDPIAKHEFKSCINHYLNTYMYGTQKNGISTLDDIIKFNEANAEKCLKHGQDILLECQNSDKKLTTAAYVKALRRRETAIADLNKIFSENNLDVLIGADEYLTIAPLTGFPSGTVPIGKKDDGVPLGMYFIARHMDESTLIRVMYVVEQMVGG
ncbi:MAG: amidase family protein [Defluviitaleaceae bacterium]|nr:amidase family protein [Defluviitaleaceae bacterium]